MFESVGAGCLLLSAFLFSARLIREHKNRLAEMTALYDMIACIRDNIEHLMKPLPEIFRTYTNPYLESCGFLPAVRENDLKSAWKNHRFAVTDDFYSLTDDFLQKIGSGYRAEELRFCEYTLGRLRKILDQTEGNTANQLKLCKTVPTMLALSLILIFI